MIRDNEVSPKDWSKMVTNPIQVKGGKVFFKVLLRRIMIQKNSLLIHNFVFNLDEEQVPYF